MSEVGVSAETKMMQPFSLNVSKYGGCENFFREAGCKQAEEERGWNQITITLSQRRDSHLCPSHLSTIEELVITSNDDPVLAGTFASSAALELFGV